jgi:peptide chain release factor subunit 3
VLIKFGCNVDDLQKGFVLCREPDICPAVNEIIVQLALVEMLEHRPIFTSGYDAVMHVHTVEIEVTCTELINVIDKGKTMKRPFGRQGQMVTCKLLLPIGTCMDTFEVNPALGRVTLRDEGRTIAIGKILQMKKVKK